MTVVLLAGALVGLGVTVVVSGVRPTAPDLSSGVARLTGAPAPAVQPSGEGPFGVAMVGVAPRLADAFRLHRYRADLAITGTSTSRMAMEKVAYALVGLVFPVLLTSILAVAGLTLPIGLPVVLAVAMAGVLSFMPDAELRRRAALARLHMRRTVSAYLELVALERAADAGAVEALERAAAIGSGPGFAHIGDALLRARLEGRTPWHQLSALAEELRVAELGDVADIMRLSGEDGAAVLPTLRARSASMRTWLLQNEVAAANEASERMSIPVALLGVAFMALLGFPAFSRILFG